MLKCRWLRESQRRTENSLRERGYRSGQELHTFGTWLNLPVGSCGMILYSRSRPGRAGTADVLRRRVTQRHGSRLVVLRVFLHSLHLSCLDALTFNPLDYVSDFVTSCWYDVNTDIAAYDNLKDITSCHRACSTVFMQSSG